QVTAQWQANGPDLVVDPANGNVFVATGGGIEPFNSTGGVLSGYTLSGSHSGLNAVAMDSNENLFAYESHPDQTTIYEFNVQGNLTATLNLPAPSTGESGEAYGMAIGPDGSFYVADQTHHLVQK